MVPRMAEQRRGGPRFHDRPEIHHRHVVAQRSAVQVDRYFTDQAVLRLAY